MTPAQELLARRCRRQAGWCAGEGEYLYAELLQRVAADVEAAGPCWTVLEPYAAEPGEQAVSLRFLAAVHALVLAGRAPGLSPFYASSGGTEPPTGAWPAFRDVVEAHAAELRASTGLPCQTNEVGRSAALLPAFLAVARSTGRPLRLLEVGCSAGFHLRFDHYWYGGWGDPASPVRLDDLYEGERPAPAARLRVVARAGCDLRPIDPTSDDGALRLASLTWPTRGERLARLRGAIEVARRVPAEVERADAVTWLGEQLGARPSRAATVVFHSVFLQYIPPERRDALRRVVAEAGRRAAADAPLAWVRMEPGSAAFEVRVSLWPRGGDVLIGTCGPHGGCFQFASGG